MSRMAFEQLGNDGAARRGRLHFPRGTVETPAFMPVGTYGSVKGVLPEQIRALGAEIILGNTFHLYLRPGLDVLHVLLAVLEPPRLARGQRARLDAAVDALLLPILSAIHARLLREDGRGQRQRGDADHCDISAPGHCVHEVPPGIGIVGRFRPLLLCPI